MATAAEALNASDDQRIGAKPGTMALTVRVRRFNPEVSQDSWWDEWTVHVDPLERLVEVLHEIKWRARRHPGASDGRARTASAARTRC